MVDKRDLVLVITDQQRFDQVGYVTPDQFDTPHLDALAADGVTFTRAYSSSTTCVPSRVGMLTGLMTHRLPHTANDLALQEGYWTVARELRRHGYQTAAVGKMHAQPMRADHGFDQLRLCEHTGFLGGYPDDEFDDYHDFLLGEGLVDWRYERPPQTPEDQWHPHFGPTFFPYPAEAHPTGWIIRQVADVLAHRDPDRPLFLVVSFLHPHAPFNPPAPYEGMYDPPTTVTPDDTFAVNLELPPSLRKAFRPHSALGDQARAENRNQVRWILTRVRNLVRQLDDALGEVVAATDPDRTTFVFTSDHGDYAGHRGMLFKAPWIPFDDLARVPLVISGSGVTDQARVSTPVQTADLTLTLLGLAGAAPPTLEPFVSRDLGPFLRGEVGDDHGNGDLRHRALPLATDSPYPAILQGDHKLIWPAGARPVLFDLGTDRGETSDVSSDPAHRRALVQLSSQLRDWLAPTPPDLPWW